jgi:hypothetical protein
MIFFFNNLLTFKEKRILEEKLGVIKKIPKRFLKILRIDKKLRKKFGNF